MAKTISCVKCCSSQVFFIVFIYKMKTKQLNIKNRSYYFYNDLKIEDDSVYLKYHEISNGIRKLLGGIKLSSEPICDGKCIKPK